MNNPIKVNATKFKQNGYTFYSAGIESKALKKCCFVSRRDEDTEKGFQRLLNKSRAKSIAHYLDNKDGAIPTALILSAQPDSKMEYQLSKSIISFIVNKRSFLVLDGQHRLYGLNEAKNSYLIPVIIFEGLNSTEEVKYFIDINTTQKGVSSSLILDIKKLAGTETKIEEKLRQLFDFVNKTKESPLYQMLAPSRSKAGKISRVNFYNTIKPVLESGLLASYDIDMVQKILLNYLKASEETLIKSGADYAKLNKSLFFTSFIHLLDEIIEKTLNDFGNLFPNSIKKTMIPLESIDYDEHRGSSRSTISQLVKKMQSKLKKVKEITSEMI